MPLTVQQAYGVAVVCNCISLVGSVQDYELQLASYSAGLETLLNVPIKRTMLKSPASTVRQEVGDPLIQHQFTVTHQHGADLVAIGYREFNVFCHVVVGIC